MFLKKMTFWWSKQWQGGYIWKQHSWFCYQCEGQVERKIHHARNMPMKVELNEEVIKIKPNSGTFKAIYYKVIRLMVLKPQQQSQISMNKRTSPKSHIRLKLNFLLKMGHRWNWKIYRRYDLLKLYTYNLLMHHAPIDARELPSVRAVVRPLTNVLQPNNKLQKRFLTKYSC